MAALAVLAGCDSNARLSPEFLKLPAPPPAAPDPEPDVRKIVRDNLANLFLKQSAPKNVEVSKPVRFRNSWTACLRASVSGATNRPVGVQTFLVQFDHGKIIRRDRVDQAHACASETYEPV